MNTPRSVSLLLGVLLLGGVSSLQADILYTVTDLGTLGGLGSTTGCGLNNAGQVVGSSFTSNGAEHAFLYSNGQMQDLGALPGYSASSRGYAINDAGQVGGSMYSPPRDVPFSTARPNRHMWFRSQSNGTGRHNMADSQFHIFHDNAVHHQF